MAFVNCELKEEEIRQYKIPRRKEMREFGGGTIDRENDIRLHKYANGPLMEPSDEYSFVFDYKGRVFFPTLRQEVTKDSVSWYMVDPDGVDWNRSILNALREAMKVYAFEGYKRFALIDYNSTAEVNILF